MEDHFLTHLIALIGLYPNTPRPTREALERYGTPEAALDALGHPDTKQALQRAEEELEFVHQHRLATFYYRNDDYPALLRECSDCPILLYGKGNLPINKGHYVSIVGTRSATEYGKDLTRRFVLDLARLVPDVTIVSGLAYGIDVAAHRAAIEADIPTVIIPAHGLDRIYPPLHRPIAVQALEKGGLLTEYPHGTTPLQGNFVARNRIVAGLSHAVVVVESKEKGGALITARMTCNYNRPLFAFPARPTDLIGRGCNLLIREQKAQLILSAEDLVTSMGWTTAAEPTLPGLEEQPSATPAPLGDAETQLLSLLRSSEEGIHINNLVLETGIPYSDVASSLMMLELSGVVRALPGAVYRAC